MKPTLCTLAILVVGLAAPAAALAVTKVPTAVAGTCLPGFVWRQAIPADHVCVTPADRSLAAKQNAHAAMHRQWGGFLGPSGPYTCQPGFVWRNASSNDHVCVTPAERLQAAEDDSAAPSRTVR